MNKVGFYVGCGKTVGGGEGEYRSWILIGWLASWRWGPYTAVVTLTVVYGSAVCR